MLQPTPGPACPPQAGLPPFQVTLAGSLNVIISLAQTKGSDASRFQALLPQVAHFPQLDPERHLSAVQRETARQALLSTMTLVEGGLVEDPHGVLTLDALDAGLDLLTGAAAAGLDA
ncbi:hypothetical protein [Deinococcus multiflagellatus]|uniref:Uncharacterized protein n=1 Tax=Deinococcus multiflagellatus TaxID=1656887 RepID=A0ABW1ZR62_9DEIO|nr:hypothetical protein [Deinococcus multiflagellatus]MBZ9715531.1 hypothetical protein [Deinococcus multiflagellatus]